MNAPDAGGVAVTTYPTRGAGERIVAPSPAPALIPLPTWRTDLELLRVTAALMVITIHVTGQVLGQRSLDHGVTWWLALITGQASRAAVPVFFAITGWLLLSRPEPGDATWLRTRVLRLAVPLVIWSVVQTLEDIVFGVDRAQPLAFAARQFGLMLTGPGVREHYWYLYFAIALTLAIWVIQTGRAGRPRNPVVVAIAAAALVIPVGLAPAFGHTVSWSGFGYAIGYAGLGFAILSDRPHRRAGLALFVGAATALIVVSAIFGHATWPSFYPSPFVVAMTAGLLWLATGFDTVRWRSALRWAGSLALGVYLVHPVVLELTMRAMSPAHPLAAVVPFPRLPLIWLIVVVVSFALAAAWHRSVRLTAVLG